jgi:DNA-directed RNA polymerase subunit N (RpoN/RPB10)
MMEILTALQSQGYEVYESIIEMRDRVLDGEDPEDVLCDFGLESDYALDLISVCERAIMSGEEISNEMILSYCVTLRAE